MKRLKAPSKHSSHCGLAACLFSPCGGAGCANSWQPRNRCVQAFGFCIARLRNSGQPLLPPIAHRAQSKFYEDYWSW